MMILHNIVLILLLYIICSKLQKIIWLNPKHLKFSGGICKYTKRIM